MLHRARYTSFVASLMVILLPFASVGSSAEGLNYNVVDLSAQARREVNNDLMQATLFAEAVGQSPAQLSATVNDQLNKAINAAKKVKSVRVESGDYQSQANYRDGKQDGWRTRGEVRLESADFSGLATLLGQLQSENLQLSSVQFSVSPQLREQVENELVRDALKAFQQRADVVRQSLNKNAVKIVSIRLETQNMYPVPRPMFRVSAMAMDKAEAAPAEAGNSEIIVMANGSIQVE